jgi:predicted Rossmann fold nucleotide-binding protein DprA/Smf involved in DNA uptake
MTSNGQSALQAQPLPRGSAEYPAQLPRVLGDHAPTRCFTLGDRKALTQPLLALFCSERCPGDLIIKTCDAATALRDAGVAVISGFHSPIERECLRILLRGAQPVVICPARSLERMRVPADWRVPITEGRLLLISPFPPKQNRMTAALAAQRNEFVAALARAVLVVYADPAGQIESLARKVAAWRKPLFTLDDGNNAHLLGAGAESFHIDEVAASWSVRSAHPKSSS